MSFSVTIIGSNSAIPAHGRHPSAQIVSIQDKPYLIDCGEGTQMRMPLFGIKSSKINHIFISHLHGDHFFGLIGLISSYHLLKRTRPLHIYAPKELFPILQLQLEAGQTQLCYELICKELNPNESEIILEHEDFSVETIVLKHRITCLGFLFREKERERKIIKEKMEEHQIPYDLVPDLKKGYDVIDEESGKTILNSELTINPLRARTYAYCCDTAYHEEIIEQIKSVDLLYHDCTFDKSGTERALQTYHSTTVQAAQIAKLAEVKQLMIGHFSSKYDHLLPLLYEAKEIFENTILAIEGNTVLVER